jgi:transposase
MSKAGNRQLRAAAYRMAVVGVQHNPVIAAHYARKRAAGKSKMNALGHCMRKALSLVWGVWRNGQDFDPSWADGPAGPGRPGSARRAAGGVKVERPQRSEDERP